MTTVSCSRTCGRTPGAHLKGLQTLAWLSIVVIASRAKHQAACFTQRLCKALGKGHVRHTAPLTPTSGTVLRVPFAGKQSPSISRPHASTSSQRVVRSYAVQEKTGTVTIEDNLSNPWAEDGWRGAYVSSQPPATQTAIVLGVTAALLAGTYFSVTTWGPWICNNVPLMDTFMDRAPFIFGPMFFLAGVTHFTEHKAFASFYPHQGAWGLWYLPGSPSFHVNWTGVAEIAGSAGLVLGSLHLDGLPGWLRAASALGLCLLTFLVTPSNMYMWTHNAPGPLDEEALQKFPGGVVPLPFHAVRGALQVFLLSTYLGLALQQ